MSKDKKVLVTGSSGFLGSHIVDALFDEGYEVILFDAIESKFKKSGQKEFIGDIRSFDDVNQAINGCDYVFHYAAQADISLSNSDPVSKNAKENLEKAIDVLGNGGAEAIILGCTEIPLAIKRTQHDSLPLINTTKILAKALLLDTEPDAIKIE